MTKVHITKIYKSAKDKDGKPLITKAGKPYTRLAIQVDDDQYKGQWISGFDNYQTKDWKEGDTVEIEITRSGQYINFRTLSKLDLLERRVEALEAFITKGKPINLTQDDWSNRTSPPEDAPPF